MNCRWYPAATDAFEPEQTPGRWRSLAKRVRAFGWLLRTCSGDFRRIGAYGDRCARLDRKDFPLRVLKAFGFAATEILPYFAIFIVPGTSASCPNSRWS